MTDRGGKRSSTFLENEKHGCAVLQFESGDQFYCWNNYARILNKAWGYDSEHWIDQEMELSLGHYHRQENRHGKRDCRHAPDLAGKAGSVRRAAKQG